MHGQFIAPASCTTEIIQKLLIEIRFVDYELGALKFFTVVISYVSGG